MWTAFALFVVRRAEILNEAQTKVKMRKLCVSEPAFFSFLYFSFLASLLHDIKTFMRPRVSHFDFPVMNMVIFCL